MRQLEVLVEDASTEEALKHLLPKIIGNHGRAKVYAFGNKPKQFKNLPSRLAAYRQRIQDGEKDLRILVLVDRDKDDCAALKGRLEAMARNAGLSTKTSPDSQGNFLVVNRIVVEELESWFLGDTAALRKAFTSLPTIPATGMFHNPDKGNWESLHRFLKKHGIYRSTFPKIEAARRIAPHMDIAANRSQSFQAFVSGVNALLA